ncbi:MAG: tetratricopeptide repeat protein, partial [Chloroflexota bacterium]
MLKIEKTVFLSYRRTNIGYALAVYQNLTQRGFDVFFDYESIQAGDFEQIILNNIESRAHFVVLLTPAVLTRLDEPGDWLRREIEYAIQMKRNIVPLTLESFDWGEASKYLTGGLVPLKNYNALRVPADYFEAAMGKLCDKRLNVTLDAVIHPRTAIAEQAAKKAKQEAEAQPTVSEETVENELTAEEWFNRGYENEKTNTQDAERFYTKAIELKPDYANAYNNRGVVREAQGDESGAIADYTKAISLKPDYAMAYYNRGIIRSAQGDVSGAMSDYDKAIAL